MESRRRELPILAGMRMLRLCGGSSAVVALVVVCGIAALVTFCFTDSLLSGSTYARRAALAAAAEWNVDVTELIGVGESQVQMRNRQRLRKAFAELASETIEDEDDNDDDDDKGGDGAHDNAFDTVMHLIDTNTLDEVREVERGAIVDGGEEEEEEEDSTGSDEITKTSEDEDDDIDTTAKKMEKEDGDMESVSTESTSEIEASPLSANTIASIAINNRIIVTWANDFYMDFVLNWAWHLKSLNVTNFIVGAMDDELLVKLRARDVPCFSMQSGLTTGDFGWGTETFHKMGREKISLVRAVTSMGFDLLLTDVDTVFLRDPNPFIDKYPDADILTSSDHLHATTTDGGLEYYTGTKQRSYARSPANIGIMYFSRRSHILGKEWARVLDEDSRKWDQNVFNQLMRDGVDFAEDREDRLFTGFGGQLKFGILPVSLFCSGHTFFVQDMPAVLNTTAFGIHATFQFGGTAGKRYRFRERMLWHDDDDSYYRGRFLALHFDVPAALLNADPSRRAHFALVNYQLRYVRALMALGEKLNRIVVLPRLFCLYDRFWFPIEDGRNGSADGPPRGPFMCPLDHVLTHLDRMARFVEFREYSFFDNPRFNTTNIDAATALVSLQPEMNVDDVEKLVEPHKDSSILVLHDFDAEGFSGFSERFNEEARHWTGLWCCDPPPEKGKPGHVHYDIFFDKVPHTDRFGRVWESENIGDAFGP